jgi:hypothetical protein
MKRAHLLICFLGCFISFSACHKNTDDQNKELKNSIDKRPKKVQSEEKLQIVNSLSEKLKKKKISLDETGAIFEQEININVQEIKVERNASHYTNSKSEMSNKIIEGCLKAIQKASAYKEIIDNETKKTYASIIELHGLTKQLRLDITVLGALEDEKGDELLAQLDLVINRIQPQANDLVISPNTPMKPLEDIFEKYILGPERLEKERTLLEQKRKQEADKLKQQREAEVLRIEQLRLAEEAKKQRELDEKKRWALEVAERNRVYEEKQRIAREEKERLERLAQAEKTRLAEQARELAERKRREEIARAEEADRRNRKERERQEEERQRLADEKEISHVKIISPLLEKTFYYHSAALNVNWSNQESLLSLIQPLKITLIELRQNSTVTIETANFGAHNSDLYFVDLAFSDDNQKLAILAGPSRIGSYGKGVATLYLWSLTNKNVERSFQLPSTCAVPGGGTCGDGFEVLGWRGAYIVVSGKDLSHFSTSAIETQPIFIINATTGNVNSSNNGYAVEWKTSDSILIGSDATTNQIDLKTGAITDSYNECKKNAPLNLYYNFCPSPLKVLGICFAKKAEKMTTLTAADDHDMRSSKWDTSIKEKIEWKKSGFDDPWCLYDADDPEILIDIEYNTELPALAMKVRKIEEHYVFIKDASTKRTIAVLKIKEHPFKEGKRKFSPRGDYVLFADRGFISVWDISSL